MSLALNDKSLVDVRDHTAASDGGLNQRVKLLVAADGKLEMTRGDSFNLEVLAGVSGELEHLSGEVLKDGGRVDGRSSTNTAASANSALQESVNSSNWELFEKVKPFVIELK